MSVPELWAYYFEYLTDKGKRSKIKEIIQTEGGIAMANEVLQTITKDEIEHIRYMTELKNRLDYQSEKAYERQEGRAEGQAEIITLLKSSISPEEIIKKFT